MSQESNTTIDLRRENSDNLAEKVKGLEQQISELKTKRKDCWDKAQILSALLVPVAIAFAGYVFSQSTKEAEIKIAETNAKVAQAQLVHSFTDALTGPQPQRRKIAIEAVLLALPDDGTRLVQTVKQFDPDAGVRAFASQRLGTSDLYAQIIFPFDSYGYGPGIPPRPVFAESAELEIHLTSSTDSETIFRGWSNHRMLKEPEVTLTTKQQNVDRQMHTTVDGASVTQTNTFERFKGKLGKFSEPSAWEGAKIEAIFRATVIDEWLLRIRTERHDARDQRWITIQEFDEFYSVTKEQRESWANNDYDVTPVFRTRLEIYLGTVKVADISGIVAYVWEHDEDVRNLHVTRFVKD